MGAANEAPAAHRDDEGDDLAAADDRWGNSRESAEGDANAPRTSQRHAALRPRDGMASGQTAA
jgi:hypothetical protein